MRVVIDINQNSVNERLEGGGWWLRLILVFIVNSHKLRRFPVLFNGHFEGVDLFFGDSATEGEHTKDVNERFPELVFIYSECRMRGLEVSVVVTDVRKHIVFSDQLMLTAPDREYLIYNLIKLQPHLHKWPIMSHLLMMLLLVLIIKLTHLLLLTVDLVTNPTQQHKQLLLDSF